MLDLDKVTRSIISFAVALALLGTTLWGQCASCPLLQPKQESAHDCCKPAHPDPCNAPSHNNSGQKPCPNETSNPAVYSTPGPEHVRLSAPAFLPAPIAQLAMTPAAAIVVDSTAVYSPPDLYLLTATLLI